MYTEIPTLKRCCFFAPLRIGLLVWAYFKLIFNILVFGIGSIWLSMYGIFLFFSDYAVYILVLFTSVLLLFLADIIFGFVLIIGIHKKHTTLLRLFLKFGIVHAVLFVTVCLMIIALLLYTLTENYLDQSLRLIVIFVTVCSSFIILQTYLLLLVRSEFLKLKTNGQFQFVNHNLDPKCTMQDDASSTDIGKEVVTQQPETELLMEVN